MWEQDDLSADLEPSKRHICAGRGLNSWRKLQMVEEQRGGGSLTLGWGVGGGLLVRGGNTVWTRGIDGEWEGQQLNLNLKVEAQSRAQLLIYR